MRPGLGIRSFPHRSFTHSLILLKSNERLCAICSDRSRQMSDHEQIAQVPQRKWATVSKSLRLLKTNERMSDWLKKCWLQKSIILFYYVLFKVFFKIHSFPLFCERCEWIADFVQIKWAMWANRSFRSSNMSKSLISLTKYERIAHFAHQKWANEWIANFFERFTHLLIFGQKTSVSLGYQMSEFPALISMLSNRWTQITVVEYSIRPSLIVIKIQSGKIYVDETLQLYGCTSQFLSG